MHILSLILRSLTYDFGTVKGLSLIYDLRRTGNVRMLANYTLQFADGTGSGATSNVELTDTEQPNVRFIVPLDYDTRHAFTVSLRLPLR
jgi:hypothetical protein